MSMVPGSWARASIQAIRIQAVRGELSPLSILQRMASIAPEKDDDLAKALSFLFFPSVLLRSLSDVSFSVRESCMCRRPSRHRACL